MVGLRAWTGAAVILTVTVGTAPSSAQDWPSFRGPQGSGVAEDGQHLPVTWDVAQGTNIRWQVAIPGLAHSSPVVWDDRVFLTTVVAEGDVIFEYGSDALANGAAEAVQDDSAHSWQVVALDKQTGQVLWTRVAYEGMPATGRHVKASQSNATPATDGEHLVVLFGSEGLYCYDLDGTLLWKRDLGVLRSGFFMDPTYEWNTASSPIIYQDLVIVQADLVSDSFIAAFDVDTGEQVWRTERDELPAWPTPLVYEGLQRPELVTAAAKFARGYDPLTGEELWRLGGHSDVTVPSPIAGRGLIFVTSGQNPIQPIYAIRPGATGDITLRDDQDTSGSVAWRRLRGGPYTPTPILYGDYLYVCSSNGVLAVYHADSGERLSRARIGGRGGSYTASAVAADDVLYYASEDGDVFVFAAGPEYKLLAQNQMGEVIMATPAISDGLLIIRTQHSVVAIGSSAE